mgnify:CR=1 FL=1
MAKNNGALTDAEARILSGAGASTPPNLEPRSRSGGDLSRNSYRDSKWDRLSVLAVANDDGTPITEETNVLLRNLLGQLIAETRVVQKLLGKLLIEVEAVELL